MGKKFLWGSATASYQCEGAWNEDGRGLSIWDEFSHNSDKNINNVTGDVASDHYHRFEEDIRMMKEGGQNSYRFSIAWPRILPEGTGEVNQKGIDFYHRMIDCLLKNGIEPNVTLYHWDLPLPLQEKGGWENEETAYAFAEYARICFSEYGDKVKLWVTINEPHYSITSMYGAGNYPPNVKDGQRCIKAAYITMLASALAVKEFRKFSDIGQIGIVHDASPCYGADDSKETQFAVRMADNIFNNWVLEPAMRGEFPQDMLDELGKYYDLSFMKKENSKIFKSGTLDFIGINYYSRSFIRPYTEGESYIGVNNTGVKSAIDQPLMVMKGMFEQIKDSGGEFTDWDMEIYPQGMYDTLMQIKQRYGNVPIYITENGVGLYEKLKDGRVEDDGRIDFLSKHIKEMLRAKEDGANVCGYYVWSTFDLYSWVNGYKKRYGLVYVDFEDDNRRIPKKSYYWYRDFIRSNKHIKIGG